jgi:hypothetical protein
VKNRRFLVINNHYGIQSIIEIIIYSKFDVFFKKTKLNNIPPLEEMTAELEVYYFPEKAPKYEYALGEEDLYMKKLTDGKKGHH